MYFKPRYLMICFCIPSSLFINPVFSKEEIEKVEVIGHRNQALDQPTLETEKLLAVAGIDGDPLAAVFS
jgi:hypothetical protein